jgi:hypothetical protein
MRHLARLLPFLLSAAALAACQPSTAPNAGFGLVAAHETDARRAGLEVSVAGAVGRRVLATTADVARLVVTVDDGGAAHYISDTTSAGLARFTDLAAGPAMVTASAYDAERRLLGEAKGTVRLVPGETGALALALQLEPAAPAAGNASMAVGVTIADGPVLNQPAPAGQAPDLTLAMREMAGISTGIGTPWDLFVDSAGTAWISGGRVFSNGALGYSYFTSAALIDEDVAAGTIWGMGFGGRLIGVSTSGDRLASFAAPITPTPHGLGVDGDGNVWLGAGTSLAKVSRTGATLGTWTLDAPIDRLVVDKARGVVWISRPSTAEVARYSLTGELLGTTAVNRDGDLLGGMAVGPDGACWIAQFYTGSVAKVAADGTYVGRYGATTLAAEVAIDPRGHVWVCPNTTLNSATIPELNPDGTLAARWLVGYTLAIAFDRAGALWTVNSMDGMNYSLYRGQP